MSVRKIKTSTGETKWEVRVYENGRGSKRTTRRFHRKDDAEAFEVQFKSQLLNRENDPFHGMSLKDRTFREEADYWLQSAKLKFSASHVVRVEGVMRELLPEIGDFKVDRFTPEFLTRLQHREKAKGSANSTVNRKTEAITTILNFSVKHRRIPYNPTKGFEKLRRETKETAFWDKNEAISFLEKMNEVYPEGNSKRWVYVAYLLALNTAMRAGEIWGLRVGDLLKDKDLIVVERQFNRVTLDFGPTKSKKKRIVPCSKALREELEKLVEVNELKPNDTFFSNEEGNPICHDNFTDRQFAKDLKRWGGKRVRFHDLRHTATTLIISSGVDIKTVKEICGHADIATTMGYIHLLEENVVNVSKVFSLGPKKAEVIPLAPTLTLLK